MMDALLTELNRPVMYFSGAIPPAPEMAALHVGDTMWVAMHRDNRPDLLMAATVTRRTDAVDAVELTAEFTMEDGFARCSLSVRILRATE